MRTKYFIPIVLAFLILACSKEKPTESGERLTPDLSQKFSYGDLKGFTQLNGCPTCPVDPFEGNFTMDGDLAESGRVMFYDKKLSLNGSVSCASCHEQSRAFTDGRKVSEGFSGLTGNRNAMAVFNGQFQNSFFWDGRAFGLFAQSTMPLMNHLEMGFGDMDEVKTRVQSLQYYNDLYEKALLNKSFDNVESWVAASLTTFMKSIVSTSSKFDAGINNNFNNFSSLEKLGKDLFFDVKRTNCVGCHVSPTFAGSGSFGYDPMPSIHDGETNPVFFGGDGITNIGLDMNYVDEGAGNGKFKIPSLRNIAITGPYMHDGRFTTLEEVIDHYNENMKPHLNLDSRLRRIQSTGMNLNTIEKKALIAFLNTLTDDKMMKDPKYGNPFKL
jgi:cytochrome c peroxidase